MVGGFEPPVLVNNAALESKTLVPRGSQRRRSPNRSTAPASLRWRLARSESIVVLRRAVLCFLRLRASSHPPAEGGKDRCKQQVSDRDAKGVRCQRSLRGLGEDEQEVDHVAPQLIRVSEPQRGEGSGDQRPKGGRVALAVDQKGGDCCQDPAGA